MSAHAFPELSIRHEHETIEAVCPRCGKAGDAICPHCQHEYEGDCLIEDHGFRPSAPQQLLARMAALARYIASRRNAKFWWSCFLVATGDAYADGVSMQELGARFRVGKACVSKTCVEICVRLGIPPSRYMRSEAARAVFRKSNIRPLKEPK